MKLQAFALAAAIATLVALSGCETMSAEECAAADWTALGNSDAAQRGASRFDDRAESCAERGFMADAAAYRLGFDRGMYVFCQPQNGFAFAHRGGQFNGVCPAELDRDFRFAFTDGQRAHSAEQALSAANSEVSRLRGERDQIDEDIHDHENAMRAEGVTEDDRRRHRDEISRLQRERRNRNDDLNVAEAQVSRTQRAIDDLRYEIGGRWGGW